MKLKTGHMVAERYEIDDFIGSGGMSVVYRAHDKKLDRYVTLKILREEYLTDENLIERFPKEARAAAALNHQNIVSIFDHGRDGDILYIVLEYVDGASLKELINRKAPFDDETNLGVTIQVTEGLSEAHRNNIIHLDIKPQNILITTTSIVKVADFGIARAAKSVTLNAAAGSMGSVHYFSPEQARGGYIDHKSDIYSLGIVMFEMATGRLPFEGENEVSVALQHINDPLPDILSINPDVSESVVKIIQKSTEKSASKRYQSIDDMTNDLKRALTDASGTFVAAEEIDEKSPTRTISEENRAAIRTQKMRAAFLDGRDMPDDDADEAADGGFEIVSRHDVLEPSHGADEPDDYQDGQEYDRPKEFSDEFFREYTEPPPPKPRDKKADRIAVYGGIFLGLVVGLIILLVARHMFVNIFSSTAGMVETPDVVGLPLAQAELEIRMAELIPLPEYEYCGVYNDDCDGNCYGTVIFQRVDAGRLLTPGDTVGIVVSRGSPGEGVSIPRVLHLTYADARAALEALGLDLVIETEFIESTEYPRNVVINQSPEHGETLTRGTTVTLHVSAGADDGYVLVPRLNGLTEAAAIELLRENSLTGASTREYSDTFGAGLVVRQYVAPGEWLERNAVVNFVVSLGRETPLPTPTPPDDNNDENGDENGNENGGENGGENGDTPGNGTITDPPDNGGENGDPDPLPPLQSGTLTIHLWPGVPEGTEFVHVAIQQYPAVTNPDPDGFGWPLNDPNVPVAGFPHSITVHFREETTFRVLSVEPNGEVILRATETRP